jgi:hypothetical protein
VATGWSWAELSPERLTLKQPDMKPPRAKKTAAEKAPTQPSAAFDLWLQRGLHQMFDDVASEPIPEELLKLIENDRDK